MIWREKRLLLIGLAVLFAANTIFFFTYRVQYENRLSALDTRLEEKKQELQAATQARAQAEQQLAAYRKVQKDIREIYDVEWSTQGQRLTMFIGEVMRLATSSHLVPRNYAFTGSTTAKSGARTSAATATEVTIGFPVEGTYEQVRRLINLLEISDQFIIIDQISLGSENGERLNMTIKVKTLFRDTAAGARSSNQEL
jgi:Tfp pilus assembly protein PilO